MIIRLLGTILSLVVLAFFVGFNLDNKCNVNEKISIFALRKIRYVKFVTKSSQ